MTRHLCAAIIEASPSRTLAIVAGRRLTAAALSAVLVRAGGFRPLHEAHGEDAVRAALERYRPALVVDAREDSPSLLCTPRESLLLRGAVGCDPASLPLRGRGGWGLTRLTVGGQDRPENFIAEVESALERAATPVRDALRVLSGREWQILASIASGKSTKQIARDCAISAKTVGNHVSNIRQKLNLRQRAQLVLFAVEQGLTSLEPAL